MTVRSVALRRFSAQQLDDPGFDDPLDLVRWMGAVQAQDYGQSLWALTTRLRTPVLAAVLAAIESGAILRTWPMRGTIHWVPAADARWMVSIAASRVLRAARSRHAQLGIDENTVDRARSLLVPELLNGRRLARPAVMQLWQDGGLRTDDQRGYHLLWTLAHYGEIAIGPMDGKQQTFLLLDERSDSRSLTAEEGLAVLAVRYVRSHGPATAHDFAWWTGTTLNAGRTALRTGADAGELVAEAADGRELWSATAAPPAAVAPGLRLLPSFDEFCLGYGDRDDVLDAHHFDRVVPGSNGIFHPIVVADGVVSGVWRRTFAAKGVTISVEMFRAGAARSDILDAVEAFAAVYDTRITALSVDLG